MRKTSYLCSKKKDRKRRNLQRSQRYSAKRRTPKWRKRKKCHYALRQKSRSTAHPSTPIRMPAPEVFSLIENPNGVLAYFELCRKYLQEGKTIFIDIAKIVSIDTSAITLLAACVNDKEFCGKGNIRGNAPEDKSLCDLFSKSGFYNHVASRKETKDGCNKIDNILHHESHYQVRPDLVEEVAKKGLNHVFGGEKPFDKLYENLIETMSNTNNHASINEQERAKWWLYLFNDTSNKTSQYTLLDLGVGIFESIRIKRLYKVASVFGLDLNVALAEDLIEGKISSRIVVDGKIRGKGIPQIVRNSEHHNFSKALLLSNKILIDLKTKSIRKLDFPMQGTMFFWELSDTISL